MSVSGGVIKQLTWYSANDEVTSWSWDSKSIYFNSNRMGSPAGFILDTSGGTPQKVFGDYYFQYDHNLVEHPTSGEIFFNDTWESSNQSQRKRYRGPFKQIVLLINEHSLSDAEMTAAGFKALKLGKIIGNETYRWIIFTSGVGMVNNSFIRLLSWGYYTLEGKDLEKTGVQPDITILNKFEDKLNGKDPQLDKAINEILKQLKNKFLIPF